MLFARIVTPILLFVIGMCLASFGNVLVCRYPNWKILGKEKYSECPKCHHRLHWYDLFPIFSYVFLGGKCRYCKEKISPQYIIAELYGGIIFVVTYFLYVYIYHQTSNVGMNVFYSEDFSVLSITNTLCISLALLIMYLASFIDHKHKEIPLTFSIGLFLLALINWIVDFVMTKNYQLNSLLGLGIPVVLFGLIYAICMLVAKVEPMGIGDIIVYASLGFLMGAIQFVIILLVSTIICSIVESIKIKKTGKKEQIAFVPYIFIGFVVSALAGEIISNGYLKLIGVR